MISLLTPTALPASATSYEDGEELPDGVTFTYWTKALFGAEPTGPSILASIDAVNEAPIAISDTYTALIATVTGNLFAFDTDTDLRPGGKARWKALLVNADGTPAAAPPGLTFPGDGTFSYTAARGPVSFYYKIDTGVWTDGTHTSDMSADSNVAKVTITVPDSIKPVVSNLWWRRPSSGRRAAGSCR